MISSRTLASLTALALALPAAGCQRDVSPQLDRIEKEQKETKELVQKLLSRPGGASGGQRPERKRHDPALTYAIPVEGSPVRGKADAPVTVVEAYEFACPACENARGVIDEIAKAYPEDVRVVYRTYIIHPQSATIPAQAACAADKQGKFLPMAELIWDKGFNAGRNLGADNMEKLAQEAGLDMGKFKADMNGDECKKSVQEQHGSLAQLGVAATPSIFVNGRYLARRAPDQFKALIEEELAKARQRIADGTKPADYYKEWVLEKGAKKL
jgi:protein-disulfide isomerase